MCLLVTLVSHAKTAEQIEMPFRVMTHMGPRKHILNGVKIGRVGYGRLTTANVRSEADEMASLI